MTDKKESIYGNRMWLPGRTDTDAAEPQLVYFRKIVKADSIPANGILKLTADSRYKLYINGNFIQEGPCKANQGNWYYDECRLSDFLREGENCIAVEVLRYPEDFSKRNHSILRTGLPFLAVAGEAEYDGGSIHFLAEAEGWKCVSNKDIRFHSEDTYPAPLHIIEHAKGNEEMGGWKLTGYSDMEWPDAAAYDFERMKLSDTPRILQKSPIPRQKHVKQLFRNVVTIREWESRQSVMPAVTALIHQEGSLTIPANSHLVAELDAGELMTGYPVMELAGGEGALIRLLYSECYGYPSSDDHHKMQIKGDRTDYQKGRLTGSEDHYTVAGYGERGRPEVYEPFWFRTFRYVRIEIVTTTELRILSYHYRETGYPLAVKTRINTSDTSLGPVWDISVRTLKRCMHETYMDCPFYEQLQYSMDSRLEILYTYLIAADDRLARKCMEDFRCSAHGDGMINSCAPALRDHVIPGFSIYYIMMVYDHMMYFGDRMLVREHLPAIDKVLDFFGSHLNEHGLVEKIGGPNQQHSRWSFIDWTKEWHETSGVPPATEKGPLTMESLLYIMGLECAARLSDYVGRTDTGREYRNRAGSVIRAVRQQCTGTGRLLQDGPGVAQYSVHCQVFGILTGVISSEEGRQLLKKTVGNKDYAQCSVAMSYYLFRAMEKAGCYEDTEPLWDLWHQMLANHLTTCVENDTDERSDCHAWAALILYEMPSAMLGVRPVQPGYSCVAINPAAGSLTAASGRVITPKGFILVDWHKDEEGKRVIRYQVPEGIRVNVKEQ